MSQLTRAVPADKLQNCNINTSAEPSPNEFHDALLGVRVHHGAIWGLPHKARLIISAEFVPHPFIINLQYAGTQPQEYTFK